MAANLIGTTGNWGIPQDEDGVLITDLGFSYSNQEKMVLDKGGEITGLSLYQEQIEAKISGLVKKDSPFAGKLGASLTLANAIPAHLNTSGGTTVITQIERSLNNEDFEKIDITAKHYPFVTSGG
jgi:hypothetical protein